MLMEQSGLQNPERTIFPALGGSMEITQIAVSFALSLVFSFILGLERKSHQHTVGIRTLVLMGISSTLLSMLSVHMASLSTVRGDPTRIAAGVITGIGFLGGGAILKLGLNIRGLTTAAIIFTTSAIGMSCGAGLYVPAAITFAITMIILLTVGRLEKRLFPAAKTKRIVLTIKWDNINQQKITDIMKLYGIIIHDMTLHYNRAENFAELTYTVKSPDTMNSIQMAADFKDKIEGLRDFRIFDK